MHAIRVRLVALVVSAVGGAISWKLGTVEPFAWLALGGFVVALAAEVVILALQPDQRWYEGRAAAESAKTLSWRYAVAGDPFPSGVADPDRAFHQSLSEVMRDLTVMPVPDTGDDSQITAEMRSGTSRSRTAEGLPVVGLGRPGPAPPAGGPPRRRAVGLRPLHRGRRPPGGLPRRPACWTTSASRSTGWSAVRARRDQSAS